MPTIKTDQVRLPQAMAEVINAVDERVLTARMRAVVESARCQTLTPEQRRSLIKEALQRQ